MGADNQAEKVMDRIARLEAAEAEIERLRLQIASSDRVINVQHDEIERLRAAATENDRLLTAALELRVEAHAEIERLRLLLARCRTILNNMAWEFEGAIFDRWHINHEPLRADAKALLPIVDEELRQCPTIEPDTSSEG